MDKMTEQAHLLIAVGSSTGKKIPLNTSPFSVGRDVESNYIDNGPGVSRKHCLLTKEHGAWWIEDLKSSNGVVINGKKIIHKTRLYYHDRIAIGETAFVFEDPGNILRNPALDASGKHIEVVGSEKNEGVGTVFVTALLAIVVAIGILAVVNSSKKQDKKAAWQVGPAQTEQKKVETVETAAEKVVAAIDEDVKLPEMVYFNTVPDGATVFLNEENVGKTPLLLTEGYDKVNNYKIELDGYVSRKGSLVFPVDKPNVKIELEQRPGSIVVTSVPVGASVYHGHHIIGKTPLLLKDWKDGEYELKINDFGYSAIKKKITVSQTEPTRLHVELEKYTRKIVVISNPPGCDVYVDGVFMGKTKASSDRYDIRSAPLVLDGIKPGGHVVKVMGKSGKTYSREIRKMPEDKPYKIYADLR